MDKTGKPNPKVPVRHTPCVPVDRAGKLEDRRWRCLGCGWVGTLEQTKSDSCRRPVYGIEAIRLIAQPDAGDA